LKKILFLTAIALAEIVIETIVVNPDNNRYSYFGK